MQFFGFGHCLVIMALFFINFGVGLYHGIHFCAPLRGNSDIFVHVDEEDKGVSDLDTPGGKQQVILINESRRTHRNAL